MFTLFITYYYVSMFNKCINMMLITYFNTFTRLIMFPESVNTPNPVYIIT